MWRTEAAQRGTNKAFITITPGGAAARKLHRIHETGRKQRETDQNPSHTPATAEEKTLTPRSAAFTRSDTITRVGRHELLLLVV